MTTTIDCVRTAIRDRARTTDSITRLAIGLVAAAVTAAVVHTVASPAIQSSVNDGAGVDVTDLALTDRVTEFGVMEPSGVVFDEATGHLVVVGDEGSIAEMGLDGAAVRTQRTAPGVEDIAIHSPTGLFVMVAEESSELVVLSPDTLAELRRFPLDRPAILADDPSGEPNDGFEGLAFRPDPSQAGGGTFYLTHQRDPSMVVAFSFDPAAEPHPIGADAVTARWTIAGTEELNAITHSVTLDRLLAVDDKRDTVVVIGLDGEVLGELAVPGNQQEGITIDSDGTMWIADDADGALLAIERADRTIQRLVSPDS